jgi:hypothetical protein
MSPYYIGAGHPYHLCSTRDALDHKTIIPAVELVVNEKARLRGFNAIGCEQGPILSVAIGSGQ